MKSFVGSERPYVLTGFDIINPGAAIGTQNVSIKVADSVVYYPESLAGPFFHGLEEGNTLSAPLVPELRKNSTNYIYLTLTTTEAAKDTRAFWDPDKEGGDGGEFTQDINTQSALISSINVSTSSFPEDTVPIAIVNVGPNFITDIEDARDMMFRLGTGGLSPDPLSTYAFREDPEAANARLEPNTLMTNALDPNAFQGGDKNIQSLKEWMDVVMTKLKELSGTTYWYEDTSTFNLVNIFKDILSTSIKSKGLWQSSDTTAGLLTWTEDILVQSVSDNKDIIIRDGNKTLADNQTMYIPLTRRADINSGAVSVNWFNSLNYVNGTLGSFENVSKGDWIKKSDDPDNRYLRVEEFYDAVNLGGSSGVPAASALSIKLSDTYGGISELKRGVYNKGVYLSSDVVVADRDDAALTDLGGDLYWLAMRSDTVMSIADLTTTTLSIDITAHDGLTAKCTSVAHGLTDGQRVAISGTTNYDGEYAVEVETVDVFYVNITGGPFADELGQSAYFTTVTTQARTTADGLQLESANHEFDKDQTIVLSDTTNYNGSFKVFPTGNTTFTVPVTSALANETAGDTTAVLTYVRTDLGPTKLEQGANKEIGNVESENIMSFIGMDNTTQVHPSYHIAPGYNTIDGFVNYNSDATDNLTQRTSKLTAMMADKAQDKTITLAPSGYTTVSNVLNGTARDISFNPAPAEIPRLDIVLPSSDQNNSLVLNGTISLEANQAAYIEIDRNDPQDYANLTFITIADITSVPLSENVIILAVRLGTDEVWLWDGFYVSGGITPIPSFISQVVIQDRNTKMTEGGTWSWDLGSGDLINSADAYMQIANLTDARNTILAQTINLAADGDIAHVEIVRSSGTATNLTVTVSQINAIAATLNTFIIARRVGDEIVLGTSTEKLLDGQTMTLDQTSSDQTLTYIGATDTADSTPDLSTSPERTVTDAQSLTASVVSIDTELDKFFGQIRLTADGTTDRVTVTGADYTMLDTTVISQELASLLLKFDGAQIDFGTGEIFESDGLTPLGQDFTPVAIAANQYRWYSVSMIPNALDSEGRITAQLLVLPGDNDGATADAATRAVFGGTKKIGQVVVQDDGTGGAGTVLDIDQADIIQLGVGSGSGGGSGAPKMIGGGDFSWESSNNPVVVNQLLGTFQLSIGSTGSYNLIGQSFTVGSKDLTVSDIGFRQWNASTATGNMTMEIYASSGSIPTGAVLVSSAAIDVSTIATSNPGNPVTFPLSSSTVLDANTQYFIVLNGSGITGNISIDIHTVDVLAGGNAAVNGGAWTGFGANDFAFEVIGEEIVRDLSFTSDIYIEQPRLDYTDNTIDQASVSPIVLPTKDHVAFIDRLNASSGGPDLTVNIDLITNVKDGQIIIARRDDSGAVANVQQLNQTGTTTLLNAAGTGIQAQQFIATVGGDVSSLEMLLHDGGATAGNANFTIQGNNGSDEPDGVILDSTIVDITTLPPASGGPASHIINFTGNSGLVSGSKYWIVVTAVAPFDGSGIIFAIENPGTYTGLNKGSNDSGANWPFTNGFDAYFDITIGAVSTEVIVGSTSTRLRNGETAKLFATKSNFQNQDSNRKLVGGGTWTFDAVEIIGAQYIATPDSTIGWMDGNASFINGQSFLITDGNEITSITLPIKRNGNPTGIVRLNIFPCSAGAPHIVSGAQIGQTEGFDMSTVPTSFTNYTFKLTTPVSVVPGQYYGFTYDHPSIIFANTINDIDLEITNPGFYADGNYITAAGGSGPFDYNFTVNTNVQGLSLSSDAHVQIPKLADTDNTIIAQTLIMENTTDVAYVSINRQTGGVNLPVTVADISTLDDTNDDLMIIARRDGDDVTIGSQSFRLTGGESKALDAGVSDQILNVIPATSNADDSGQARLKAQATPSTVVDITSVTKLVPDGTEYGIQLKNLLLDFTGATIDFATGTISTGINFIPVTIAANQYRWHSVTLLPGAVGVDGKIAGQLLVLAAAADGATADAAPRAAFATGIQLGQIVIQDDGAGGAGTVLDINQSDIIQLSATGGGGGEGDANALLERLRDQLEDGPYENVGYNIYNIDEDDKLDGSSTGSFDIANGIYDLDTAETMASIQMLDSDFLAPSDPDIDAQDVPEVELTVFWDPDEIDNAATYEVSRMAGQVGTWQTIDISRVKNTETYQGNHKFTDEGVLDAVDEYDVANADAVTDLEGNGVNAIQKLGTPLTITDTSVITNVQLYIDKLGSPLGNLRVSIVRDDTTLPSTAVEDILSDSNLVSINSLSAGVSILDVAMPAAALVPGTYHVVVETDASYKASYSNGVDELRLRVDTSSPTGNDIERFDGTTLAWTTQAGVGLTYKVEGRTLDLRVRVTASQTSSLAGYGIFYDGTSGYVTGVKNKQVESFDGTIDNENEFLLNFLPDADLLKVYEVGTGQVYVDGSFILDGFKVVFPANTFNKVGTVTLSFCQQHGTSFDNSDTNAALLSANRLGSTDPSLDKSITGEGILLRATNGNLVEASIQWNGSSYQWVFSEV